MLDFKIKLPNVQNNVQPQRSTRLFRDGNKDQVKKVIPGQSPPPSTHIPELKQKVLFTDVKSMMQLCIEENTAVISELNVSP